MEKDCFNVGAINTFLKRLIAIWFCVLVFPSVAEGSPVQICAIIGQAAKLFSIYYNYEGPVLYNATQYPIATWNGYTHTVSKMDDHYDGKIYMDKRRNIWIVDLERKDAGVYYLRSGQHANRLETILSVKDQPQECQNNYLDVTKEGKLTEEQIMQIRKLLDDHTEDIKTCIESRDSSIKGLIALSALQFLAMIIVIIVQQCKKCCSESKQSTKSHEYAAVTTKRSGLPVCVSFRRFPETVDMETAQNNETDIGEANSRLTNLSCETIPKLPQPSSETIPKLPQPSTPLPSPILPTARP